jgi:hypothetical protein
VPAENEVITEILTQTNQQQNTLFALPYFGYK